MRGILTDSSAAVMTVGAIARDIGMIEARLAPGRENVTVIALIAALNMAGGFTIRPDIIVASIAAIGCTGEQAVDMTAIALHIAMSSREGKAGCKMVELGSCVQVLGLHSTYQQHKQG